MITPTEPLSPAGQAAARRLELALGMSTDDLLAHEAGSYVRVTPEVQRAVTRYEVAAARYAELTSLTRDLTGAEFGALALAQKTMAASRAALAAAGQLHLIEVA